MVDYCQYNCVGNFFAAVVYGRALVDFFRVRPACSVRTYIVDSSFWDFFRVRPACFVRTHIVDSPQTNHRSY